MISSCVSAEAVTYLPVQCLFRNMGRFSLQVGRIQLERYLALHAPLTYKEVLLELRFPEQQRGSS